jgi:hypothetical protein
VQWRDCRDRATRASNARTPASPRLLAGAGRNAFISATAWPVSTVLQRKQDTTWQTLKSLVTMFLELLDDAILKIVFLFIRFIQIFDSLFIVGAIAQFCADTNDADNTLSNAYVAVLAIGCVAAAWSMLTSLVSCCGGSLFFNIDLIFDFLVGVCFVVSAVLLRTDGRARCTDFNRQYFGGTDVGFVFRDCNLVKAVYALSIVNM